MKQAESDKDLKSSKDKTKGKNIKSHFLEKSKNILRQMETIYINDKLVGKFANLNSKNQTVNDVQLNPYISDDKSALTGFNGIIGAANVLNTSQESLAYNLSHLDNQTNFNFPYNSQYNQNI